MQSVARILVTGAAGFVGAHACAALARAGHAVAGCDSFNDYYPAALKRQRSAVLLAPAGVHCTELDICDLPRLSGWMSAAPVDLVLHLAAQAGVRHSYVAPMEFVRANLEGFGAVLEACRRAAVPRLVYASSSSVYGGRTDAPFREQDRVDRPQSLYAATKLANEAMAHAHAHQHGLQALGLRLFTVYGPWGRPDMAAMSFAARIRRGEAVPLFGGGQLQRDFTYIDDAVHAIVKLVQRSLDAVPDRPGRSEVVNVGHHRPVAVLSFVQQLADAMGMPLKLHFVATPPSEVPLTCADDTRLRQWIGDWPQTPLPVGLGHTAQWMEGWEEPIAGPA